MFEIASLENPLRMGDLGTAATLQSWFAVVFSRFYWSSLLLRDIPRKAERYSLTEISSIALCLQPLMQ